MKTFCATWELINVCHAAIVIKGGETKFNSIRSHNFKMHETIYTLSFIHQIDINGKTTLFRTIAEHPTNNSAFGQRGFLRVFILQYTCFSCPSNHCLWYSDYKCRQRLPSSYGHIYCTKVWSICVYLDNKIVRSNISYNWTCC